MKCLLTAAITITTRAMQSKCTWFLGPRIQADKTWWMAWTWNHPKQLHLKILQGGKWPKYRQAKYSSIQWSSATNYCDTRPAACVRKRYKNALRPKRTPYPMKSKQRNWSNTGLKRHWRWKNSGSKEEEGTRRRGKFQEQWKKSQEKGVSFMKNFKTRSEQSWLMASSSTSSSPLFSGLVACKSGCTSGCSSYRLRVTSRHGETVRRCVR